MKAATEKPTGTTDVKDLIAKARSVKRPVKYPSKTSINLAAPENRAKNLATLGIGLALIAVIAIAVAKFGVIDQFARLNEAERNYETIHEQYEEVKQIAGRYDDVLKEYRTYSMKWMYNDDTGKYVTVDRQQILDLVEEELMSWGTVNNIRILGQTLYVDMSGMDLEEISMMFTQLQQSPIVSGITLGRTETDKEQEKLNFSITVQLQPEKEEAAK